MRAACLVFAVWTGAAILSGRCLYADGAHEFVRVLEAQDFVSLMWSRHFAFYLYEFPLVLAIKLGVTKLAWLRLAFGLGRFLPWPVALLACRWLAPKQFWLAVVGCAAGYLNAAFVADGTHNLAHALFWPALFAILFARPLKPLAAVMLLASATALLYSYESQLFLCLVLALLAGGRAWREKQEGHRAWVVFLTAAGLLLAGTTIGLCGVLIPELPACFSGFRASTRGMLGHMGWTMTWTVVWASLAVAVSLSEAAGRLLSRKIVTGLLLAGLMIWGTWPLLRPARLDTGIQCDNRALDLFVPLALLPVALALRFRPQWMEPRRGQLLQLAAGLLLAQSVWQLSATCSWYTSVVRLQAVLNANHGIIPLRATVLAADGMEGRDLRPDALGGRFDWAWPCLSVAFTPSPHIQSLVCSEVFMDPTIRRHFWQPFDPFKPETLPNLDHYGLDFSNYMAAVREFDGK
jgi:hypothetical protein